MTRVAAVQISSGDDMQRNLQAAADLVEQARNRNARLAVLPECFALMPATAQQRQALANPSNGGLVENTMSELAKSAGIWILAAGIFTKAKTSGKIKNTTFLFDDKGAKVARYDKINLFDITLPNGERYLESSYTCAGDKLAVADTPAGTVGITVCYDLRFPAMYTQLASLGAKWFVIPSAFAYSTGQAHWEVLVRARAIENHAYVVAPAQWGVHPSGRRTYGHTMIVDPWGKSSVCRKDENCVLIEDVSIDEVDKIRTRFTSKFESQ